MEDKPDENETSWEQFKELPLDSTVRQRLAAQLNELKISFITKERILVTVCDLVAAYLEEHEVFVETKSGNAVRMGLAGFNKKDRKTKKFDKTIIPLERIPAFARQYLRIRDQIRGERTLKSLATEAQLLRVRQFYEILDRRTDNTMVAPAEIDQFSHGEIGRLRSDLEAILVKEGLWDPEKKEETEKAAKLKKRRVY